MFKWTVFCYEPDVKNLEIYARTFDEALSEARKIDNRYCGASVVEDLRKLENNIDCSWR